MAKSKIFLILPFGLVLLFLMTASAGDDFPPVFEYQFPNVKPIKIYSGAVTFEHKKHFIDYKIACVRCHHDIDPDRERFEAGRMMPRTGICPVPVRSLQQVRMLLTNGKRKQTMRPLFHFFLTITLVNLPAFHLSYGEPPPDIVGKVAYSEVMNFDSDDDRQPERVQFWAYFEARQASRTPGKTDFIPERGQISFYLVDVDTMEPVKDFPKFTMADMHAYEKPAQLSNIRIEGYTVCFQARVVTYTMSDGGPGYGADRVVVDDGKSQREIKLYGGNISIRTKQ